MKPYIMTGKVSVVGDTKAVGQKGFTIREFVLEEAKDSKYPNLVPFRLTKDNCELLDSYKIGDAVIVSFYINGRKWTGKDGVDKYFSANEVVKIESASCSGSADVPQAAEPPEDIADSDVGEDIPF
jgi:hypothetical protein